MLFLHKYIFKELIKMFSIIQMVLLTLFVFIEYFSKIDKFLNSEITMIGALIYVLLELPLMFVQLTPASILLSTILVFGLMNKNNEFLAIRSSGLKISFLLKPAAWTGLLSAGLIFFLGETLVPIFMNRVNLIEQHVMQEQKEILSLRKNIWIKSENKLIHINSYDAAQQIIEGIRIISLDKNFDPISQIDSIKGFFNQREWVFENIIEQVYTKDSLDYETKLYKEKRLGLAFKPEDIETQKKKSNEMNYVSLIKHIKKIEGEGYSATTYKVDLYAKFSFPFVCIIMVLIGTATGISSFTKQRIPMVLMVGVVIAFIHSIVHGFCLSLGYSEILPAFISAWFANFFFFIFGTLYLFIVE